MNVRLWGTRGSQATPGHDTVRYGGNTSCVEVRAVDDSVAILDAGTGLRVLGLALPDAVKRVDILLTHLHMDHIQGLGFFNRLFRADSEVHIWGPASATAGLRTRLTRYMSPPLFPVRLPDLPCDLHVHDITHERIEVPGLEVRTALVCHPGATVGYRVSDDNGSLAYIPDHEPFLACADFEREPAWCSGLDLALHADVLLHDAQYSDDEYAQRVGWGHSTLEHALAFAKVAKVKRLMPFHHDPAHGDEDLDRFFAPLREANLPFGVEPACEGAAFEIVTADAGSPSS